MFCIFLPGLPFAQGTNIILRPDRAMYLMDHEKEMDWTIIDDAQLLLPFGIHQLALPIYVNSDQPGGFVYRNRTDDREEDVARMIRICYLSSKMIRFFLDR